MAENKETVLVVDDEDNIRAILKRTLEKEGFKVIEASNGNDALEAVRKHDIRVVILDIRMPGLSGLEVLEEISAYRPDVGVIMATAVDDIQTAVDTMKIGAYDYIQKPFSPEDVVEKVRKAAQKMDLKRREGMRLSQIQDKLSEQSQQLAAQFRELLAALTREHRLLTADIKSKSGQQYISGLPPELQKPMSSVDEFKEAIIRILKRQKIE